MFEGMSDDEEDFQSVSQSVCYSSSNIMDKKISDVTGPYYNSVFLNVWNRGAQQVPPAEQEAQQECVQCL